MDTPSSEDFASPEEIQEARKLYCHGSDNNIEIDDLNVKVSRADEGTWVQAWVWLENEVCNNEDEQ